MSEVRLRTSDGWINIFIDPASLVRDGVIDSHNSFYAAESITALLSLLADSPLPFPKNRKPKKTFFRLIKQLRARPLRETIREWSSLSHELLTSVNYSGKDCTVERTFLSQMKDTPVFMEYFDWFKTGRATSLQYVLSFLVFLKKGKFEVEDLDSIALRDWLEVEERLSKPLHPDSIDIQNLRNIIRILLPDPDPSKFFPKHGPGQVSEGVGRYLDGKHKLAFMDAKAHRMLNNLVFSYNDEVQYLGAPTGEACTYATLRFVPKDITKTRSICMEPSYRMYLQQGILSLMTHAIDAGFARSFIFLNDQTVNQRRARIGSITGRYDTIDLSSASDSVGLDLVRQVFPRKWLYPFLATRSEKMRYGSDVYTLRKFAPMGSAVCFPVQSIIFLSVVILCSLRARHRCDRLFTHGEILHTLLHFDEKDMGYEIMSPVVYGDDIICDSIITNDVIQTLESLRFRVNVSKSFTSSKCVRESCGKYYCCGEDITPIRFLIPNHGKSVNPRVIASFIGLANNAHEISYAHVRRFAIRRALYTRVRGERRSYRARTGQLRIPFVTDPNEFGILCSEYQIERNRHLIYSRREDIQRSGWRSLMLADTKKRVIEVDKHEKYSYSLYWRAKDRTERLTRSGHARSLPEDTRFVWGWTPKQ
jgi:hypothetical protein